MIVFRCFEHVVEFPTIMVIDVAREYKKFFIRMMKKSSRGGFNPCNLGYRIS